MSPGSAGPMAPAVAAVIPAHNEARRIAATVNAVSRLPAVTGIVVVDDGSTDDTGAIAEAAGALVVSHHRRRGKAAAMLTGADAVRPMAPGAPLLFLDADLESTAAAADPLIRPVLAGDADMTIATLPRGTPGGGHGFVVRLAANGIERATGWRPAQPLSGQRCITRALFDALQPLARGFGVETGLTIDALRQGATVVECPVPFSHRVTGRGWRDQRHRARQYRDVWLALASRRALRSR